jgi:sugar/nucleoside kinase (ribokinase family)
VEGVVVHLGSQGAGFYARGHLHVEPPAPVKAPVNTTGTGDVLSVCMMLLLRHPEMPIPERLRLANSIVAEFIEGQGR